MRSSFTGIEMAKRALFTQQAALLTTGHNIDNTNTRGYSRQVVNMVAARPIEAVGLMRSTVAGQMGQSVEFTQIKRIRETFLDDQYYNENQSLGEWEVRKDALEKIEAIINEPSDTGIRQVIQNFWNSWQELSKQPDNLTARAVVKESAIALSDAFNHTSKQMQDLASDLTDNINVQAVNINSTLGQISALNQEIYRVEGLGNDANDLRDQRDVLMDDLSKVINITRTEGPNGYTINMGGQTLVDGFNVTADVTPEFLKTAMDGDDLKSGNVYGLFLSRDKYLKDYQDQLNTMINTMVNGDVTVTLPAGTIIPEGTKIGTKTYSGTATDRMLSTPMDVVVKGINGLHHLGYTLGDGEATSGGDFFVASDGSTTIDASNIALNPNIVNGLENIATSMRTAVDTTTGDNVVVKGNNDLALLMAGLTNKKFNFDPDGTGKSVMNGGTVDEFFRAVIGQLGVQANEATRQTDNSKILVDQVDGRRQSVSGVSLDEEMANMIKFQHAYNAAARSMTTFDECLDKVINSMGVVGR